jgi:transporter family protein
MNVGWLVLALLSAIAAALVTIFGKIGLKNVDANTATAIRAVIMAAFLLIVIALQGKLSQIPSVINNKAIYYIILSGIAGALSWMFYFLALKLSTASQVAVIDRLSIVFVIILATLFLGEKFDLKTALGTVLIATGAILIALK